MRQVVGVVLGGFLALVLAAEPGPARRATFPGPNGRLAFSIAGEVWTAAPDGSARQKVFTRTRDLTGYSPAWAPDGNRIAFENRTRPNGGITILNADGSGRRRVTTQEADNDPAWSPDGSRIAFTRSQSNRIRLHVVNVDGSGLRVLTPDLDRDVDDPEWSPDGARIAFSDSSDVYVIGADGTGLQVMTGGPGASESGRAQYPSWSPDGSRIAYSYTDSLRVVPVSAPGSGTDLIGGLREVWESAWSPDGSQIAFVNDAAGPLQEEIWVMNADGSNVRRLNVDSETDLDWGRQGAPPPPVAGVSVNVTPVAGVVRVRLRGTNRFVNLARLRNVPVGSELDVTRGRVRLVSAAGGRRTQTGVFFQGRGVVRQNRGRTPVTTLQVSGPLVCPRRTTAQRPPPRVRRLWGDARGRFSTRGRYATAAVRGTIWLTEDRCDGTLIRVRSGRVQVRDLVARRTIQLRAGQSYLARRTR